jgi:hypothetical protein
MVILLFFLGVGRPDLLFSRRYARPPSQLCTEERKKMTIYKMMAQAMATLAQLL